VQMPFRVHADARAAVFYSAGLKPFSAIGELARMTEFPKRKSPGAKREGQPRLSAGITWRFSQPCKCTRPQPWHQEEKSCSREHVYVVFIVPELSSPGETPVYLRRFMPGIRNHQFIWRKAVNSVRPSGLRRTGDGPPTGAGRTAFDGDFAP
jgi:hypothetical protein